MKIGVVFL